MTNELAVLDATEIERAADPGEFVVLACERAKQWLAQALEHGDIDQIVELKSQAEAIRVYTAQKQLGKDAELSAAEIVRRAERGLGLAVKRGQDNDKIETPTTAAIAREAQARGCDAPPCSETRRKAREFFAHSNEETAARSMAETSDEEFDAAIEEAKAESNLSRANVVRKAAQKRIVSASDKADSDFSPAAAAKRRERIPGSLAGKAYTFPPDRSRGGRVRRPGSSYREGTGHRDPGGCGGREDPAHRTPTASSPKPSVLWKASPSASISWTRRPSTGARIEQWSTSLADSLRTINRLARQLKELTRAEG